MFRREGEETMWNKIFLALLFLPVSPMILSAAEKVPQTADIRVAMEFLRAKGTPQLLERNCRVMMDQQLTAAPELKKFRPEMEAFFAKVFGFDSLGEELAKIYLKKFTVDELQELTVFYRTPVGRKLAASESESAPEIAALLTKRATGAMPDLHKALKTAADRK